MSKVSIIYVIQGNYGVHGWEDLTAEKTREEARERLHEYEENEPESPHRVRARVEDE